MPGRGQLLSCVARDPVLSQPSALPHWQCDSKAHLELQELWLHPTKEDFLYKPLSRERKFILPRSVQQTFPCGSLVRARSRASPTLITTKETGMTMTGLHPSRTIPRLQGTGALHLNTSAKEEKKTGLTARLFTESQCSAAAVPIRRGVGFLQAAILSPHQPEISRHRRFSQTRNPGRIGAVSCPSEFPEETIEYELTPTLFLFSCGFSGSRCV